MSYEILLVGLNHSAAIHNHEVQYVISFYTLLLSTVDIYNVVELSWLAFPRVTCDCMQWRCGRSSRAVGFVDTVGAQCVPCRDVTFLLLELSSTQVPCSPTQEDYCWNQARCAPKNVWIATDDVYV
jgi:hypothetical protein